MNTIDIKNIEKEIAKRKAEAYVFETGGELSKDKIVNADIKTLNNMINDFSNSKKETANEKIKAIVDEIFEKYAEGNDNCIILGACCYYDDSRCIYESENPLVAIDFDGFGHRYNDKIYPIGRDWDMEKYSYEQHKTVDGEDDEKYEDLHSKCEQINELFGDIGVKTNAEYYEEDNDGINEMWYGVHAITKDYKIVTFVIRNDGMLCNGVVDTLYQIK